MPNQRRPVREMSFPAQVAEMAERGAEAIRRKMSRGQPTRQGRSYADIIDEQSQGRRRSAQSTDDSN